MKIKQYEFALQEALVFLAKPLDRYQEWIESEHAHEIQFDFASLIGIKIARQVPGKASTTITQKTATMTPLEINCMESMRLCFNFLWNCQKHNVAIDNGTYRIPNEETMANQVENESLALTSSTTFQYSVKEADITNAYHAPEITKPLSSTNLYLNKPSRSASGRIYVEDSGGDLSLEELEWIPSNSITQKCDQCHKTLLHLDSFKDQLKSCQSKNIELAARVEKEVSARKICQQAKDMIDREIEEITAELFSRANQMVIEESKRMDLLCTSNRELTKRVSDFASRLKEKEVELGVATKALYEVQGLQEMSGVVSDSKVPLSQDKETETSNKSEAFIHSIFSGFDQFKASFAVDGYLFQEFQEFVKVMGSSSKLPSHLAYLTIHGTLFMKRCMSESVEPCLFYSYALSNTFKTIGGNHPLSFKKKLLDFAIKCHISISCAEGKEDSPPPTKSKCLICTLTRICEYKINLGEGAKPESCCRFCRDRILSVQDFFHLIAFLSSGKHGLTILSTFRQILWTRRRMAIAIVGSCSLFETETSAILGPGSGGNWEKLTRSLS